MDAWLREHAAGARVRRVARTSVWVESDGDPHLVIGYYSLTGHRLVWGDLPKRIGRGSPAVDGSAALIRAGQRAITAEEIFELRWPSSTDILHLDQEPPGSCPMSTSDLRPSGR